MNDAPDGIVIHAWQQHQRAAISKILRVRCDGGIDLGAPYSRPSISFVTNLDADFQNFAREVGRDADALWLRTLQWVGQNAGLSGAIELAPKDFGPFVLSRPWHSVSRSRGILVRDALLTSSLASPVTSSCEVCGGASDVMGHVICDATIDVTASDKVKGKWKKKGKKKRNAGAPAMAGSASAVDGPHPPRPGLLIALEKLYATGNRPATEVAPLIAKAKLGHPEAGEAYLVEHGNGGGEL